MPYWAIRAAGNVVMIKNDLSIMRRTLKMQFLNFFSHNSHTATCGYTLTNRFTPPDHFDPLFALFGPQESCGASSRCAKSCLSPPSARGTYKPLLSKRVAWVPVQG